MNDLATKSVESFADVITGGTPSTRKPEYWNGDIPWLNSGALNDGHIKSASKFITRLGLRNSSAKMMPKDTVLVALTGATTGQVGFLTFPASANQSVTGIIPSGEHDSRYLYYFLKTQRHKFLKDAFGGAQPHINQRYVKEFKIPLPDLSDQKRIAYLLSKVEGLIAQRKQHLKDLDDLIKSVFVNMFGDPVRNEKGWDKIELNSLLDDIESGRSPKCEARQANPDEWGVLKLGAVTLCEFRENENKALPRSITPIAKHEVKQGDLLFSRKNTHDLVAASAYVFETRSQLLLPDLIFRLVLKNDSNIEPIFLWQLLLNSTQRKAIQSLAGGAAGNMPNISKAKLRAVKIPRPPKPLQEILVKIVSKARHLKGRYTESLSELEQLYGSLSQRAFAGELDLSRVPIMVETTENIEMKDEATFEKLPEIELPEYENQDINTAEGRKTTIEQWFSFYQNARADASIEVNAFVDLANRRLEDLMDEPTPIDVETFDWLSSQVWVQLKEGEIQQGYDEEKNSIKLTRSESP